MTDLDIIKRLKRICSSLQSLPASQETLVAIHNELQQVSDLLAQRFRGKEGSNFYEERRNKVWMRLSCSFCETKLRALVNPENKEDIQRGEKQLLKEHDRRRGACSLSCRPQVVFNRDDRYGVWKRR